MLKTFTSYLAITIMSLLGLGGASLAFAHTGPHDPQGNPAYTVHVMKHLCNPNIKNIQDFEALEAGRTPVAALANTVLNCPTTGLVGDAAVAGTVASPRTTYNFTVKGKNQSTMSMQDQDFMAHKLCESDIGVDVDANGAIASTTCLDISHYEFMVLADDGRIDVRETMPPSGFKFGTVRFTPTVLNGNNDQDALVSTNTSQGLLKLNMTNDTDGSIMLHVYNFRTNATTTPPNNPPNTPPNTPPMGSSLIQYIRAFQSEAAAAFLEKYSRLFDRNR